MAEITFASAKDAVRWAEEVATLPNMKGCLASLHSRPGAGNMSRQDAIEVAMTISNITAACKPYRGQMMKAIYGGREPGRNHELGIALAGHLLTFDAASDKTSVQLVNLGVGMIQVVRERELFDRRYPVKRIAKDIGISRERFCKAKSWRKLRRESEKQIHDWMDLAIPEIELELSLRGWMA